MSPSITRSQLRILCFLHSFEPGGVEKVALRLCGAWDRAGHRVAVMIGRWSGAAAPDAPALRYIVPRSGRFPVGWFETLWMILTLPRIIRRERPDVLFCAGNSYAVVAVAMKLLLGRDCPPILAKISNGLDRHDMPRPLRLLYRLWCRIQGDLIDHFIGMSPPMQTEIGDAMGIGADRVSIILNPILSQRDLAELARAGEADARSRPLRGRRFLAAGRLVPQKDFAAAIRAFAAAAGPDDRLTIVGEGPERQKLEAFVVRLGLAEQVRLPGHARTMTASFADSDVLLLTSRYEGLPGVVVEALAAGLTVIATDCCVSMADLLLHGRLGRIVPPGDEAALAEAIRQAKRCDATAAERRSQAGRFTVERTAGAYVHRLRMLARPEAAEKMRAAHAGSSPSRRPTSDT